MTRHEALGRWVEEAAALCGAARVVWLDGSEEEKARLEATAVSCGELVALDPARFPGSFLHRTDPRDASPAGQPSFVCCRERADAGPNNDWMSPEDGYRRGAAAARGSMKGRTMFVVPFALGPAGSPLAKAGVQVTDSAFVCLMLRVMTRVGTQVLAGLGADGAFTRCLHATGRSGPGERLVLHFPEDDAVWSVGSGFAGAPPGMKSLSLRVASWRARREGWLAEHMLVLGVEDPAGRVDYLAAALPSACGKTNLAMLAPPESLRLKGWKTWTVADDVAWLRVGEDGRLWAVNPERGFSGVAPGTSSRSNPNALETARRNALFTNVVLGEDRSVWWEDGEGPPPPSGTDWRGRPWKPGLKDESGRPVLGAHPNGRLTAPLEQCPTLSPRAGDPLGVPISAIVFGGRRARLAPLVSQSFDWEHGVYMGATVASERTPARDGVPGELRRDPMAMLPFCGYDMGDYFAHWLSMGRRAAAAPKIFHVNWFRRDGDGRFLWPGRGENLRVLQWVLARARGEAKARQTPAGWVPAADSLDLGGLRLPAGTMEALLRVDPAEWTREAEDHRRLFSKIGRVPPELSLQVARLEERLAAVASAGR